MFETEPSIVTSWILEPVVLVLGLERNLTIPGSKPSQFTDEAGQAQTLQPHAIDPHFLICPFPALS